MKRLLLALVAACSLLTAAAQQSSVCVYGIDFSLTRTAGAGECREDFAEAFRRINLLLRSEADKYDFARALRQPLVLVDIEPMLQHLSGCSYEKLYDTKNFPSEEDIGRNIASYALDEQEGTGVVMVALLLDKRAAQAVYEMVFFDIATREVCYTERVEGHAGGFGLRNYWANTIAEVLRTWRREHREPLLL